MVGRRFFAFAVGAMATVLIAATPAQATFHEMSIREVYPGGSDNASYVELQMWAEGQNFVANHHLVAYNSNGTVNEDFKFGSSVASGQNQATILVADTSYGSVFAGKPAPDASDEKLNLSPTGGAVCWVEGSPPDCVAWGNFTGPLPSHVPELKVGNPVAPTGVKTDKALRRSILPGCSTLLDPPPTDDSDDSATDFSEQEPNPRDNASPIVEMPCPSLPNTVIKEPKPANPTKLTSASFTYEVIPATGASFECALDESGFSICEAGGKTYSGLSEGSHTFQVRAVNGSGTDPTPAAYSWRVDTTPPTATIKNHPQDPSPGASAAFTYQSNEVNSTFECSLSSGGPDSFASCPLSGKTYTNLADGVYTFKVRATDLAGNQQPTPAEFTWEVDNSLGDTTPPETTLVSHPPDPSSSSTASFTYVSNEPGSTFACKLDGAAFSSCPAAGITYTGLANGPHSFQVRATDPSNNTDPTPAGYTFDVVLSAEPTPLPLLPKRPETTIGAKPPAKTHDRTPTFRFSSDEAGSAFQCKLDGKPFRACRSPFTTKRLALGRHTFRVRARDASGNLDPSPASYAFRVIREAASGR